MTKRLVDIDDELLRAGRAALGTATMKDTVNEALRVAVALAAREANLQRFERVGLPDLRDPEVMSAAWR